MQPQDPEPNAPTPAAHPRARVVHYAGHVQGVGFRATCLHIAQRHPAVTGTVQNQPDGTVRLLAQAPDQHALDAFITGVRDALARHITEEHARPATPDPSLTAFSITR